MSTFARAPTLPPLRADNDRARTPASIWLSRAELAPSAQERLLSTPIFKIVAGKLQLDADQLAKIADAVPSARSLLLDFEKAVSGKRAHEDGDSEDGDSESRAKPPKRARPPSTEAEPRAAPASPPAKEATPRSLKPPRILSRALELPRGAAAGDKIRLFDLNKKKKVGEVFEVPEDAHEGMKLDFMHPPDSLRLVFEDGAGFIAGGSSIAQHGTRLRFHRKTCRCSSCPVMGCGGDSSAVIFDSMVDDETCRRFEAHAKAANKRGLQFHINRLQARRSVG
tara:strand:+ start:634 stop:1476 length:843 start_codon:yes stop_codon:yes gene_type:complete